MDANFLSSYPQWFRCFRPHNLPGYVWGWGKQIVHKGMQGIDTFLHRHKGQYIFCRIPYDLRTQTEPTFSSLPSHHLIELWVPQFIAIQGPQRIAFKVQHGNVGIDKHVVKQEIKFFENKYENNLLNPSPHHTPAIEYGMYKKAVATLLQHIQLGDIYEINFCTHTKLPSIAINPLQAFHTLIKHTAAPYGCVVRDHHLYTICGSPERFIRRKQHTLYMQPMKGTAARHSDKKQDEAARHNLATSEKERAENMMIVDLTRNDLSKIAQPKSVKVKDICAIQSFPHVHQMISTIQCRVPERCKFSSIIHATYPMGSMTGAPKVRAMQLIDKHEQFDRQWFSGSAGIILPNGDFDLNVIIRSIFYDSKKHSALLMAGGAITANSIIDNEYHEMLLKMKLPFQLVHTLNSYGQ